MTIRSALRVTLLLLAPVVAACYQSPVPLGPVDQGTIDQAFVGTWTCVDPKDAANRSTLTSRPLNTHQYAIEWRESPTHVTRYHVHASTVAGETLFNVQELDTTKPGPSFAFLRARVAADRALSMAIVEADALNGQKGEAAIRAIARRVADPTLYGPFATCTAVAVPGAK
jgi:hypothetical protein